MTGGRSTAKRDRRAAWILAVALATGCMLTAPAAATATGRPRVVGGGSAAGTAWPSIVALLLADRPDARQGQFCGGTLIQRRWVLTAAHCVEDIADPRAIQVAIGNRPLSSIKTEDRRTVSQILIDPNRARGLNTHDAALLKLQNDASASSFMRLGGTGERGGQVARIAGWGETQTDPTEVLPDALQEAAVPIQPQTTCAQLVADYDASTMLCAGPLQGGVDTCQGDSGGPLALQEGLAQLQIGITSFGVGCAQPNHPGVYARVDAARPWIYSQLSPAPVAVVNARLAPDAETITVSWRDPDTGSEPPTYEVLDTSSGARQITSQPTAVFRTLAPRTYLFQVTPYNTFGRALPVSTPSTVTIPDVHLSLVGPRRLRVRAGRVAVPCRATGAGIRTVCGVTLRARLGRRHHTKIVALGSARGAVLGDRVTLRVRLSRSGRTAIRHAHGRLAVMTDLSLTTVAKGRRTLRVRTLVVS